MKGFDFEEKRLKQEIQRLKPRRVLLQMPEGLKPEAPRIARIIEKSGALAIVSGDPCYGACDIAVTEAESLGADLIVHFGHSKLVNHERVPTIYFESRANQTAESAVIAAVPFLSGRNRIGLATTVQHVQILDSVRELLVRAGKTIIIGDARQLPYAGQVIGCNFGNVKSVAKDVDAFLFLGGGRFHALGVALATGKPTVVADPYSGTAYALDAEVQKILKQRYASIGEVSRAKNLGVLISLKPGQKHVEEALKVKATCEKLGYSCCLFAIREIQPSVLAEFPTVDAYINTACPRISMDDASRFGKPVLTLEEFKVVSGETSWENLLKNGLFEN